MKPYQKAQRAIADLKAAIHELFNNENTELTNVEIGKSLGIYHGHSGKHQGHISRVLLELMQAEGVVEQDKKTKAWKLKK
jgi:hypothetical protein